MVHLNAFQIVSFSYFSSNAVCQTSYQESLYKRAVLSMSLQIIASNNFDTRRPHFSILFAMLYAVLNNDLGRHCHNMP